MCGETEKMASSLRTFIYTLKEKDQDSEIKEFQKHFQVSVVGPHKSVLSLSIVNKVNWLSFMYL